MSSNYKQNAEWAVVRTYVYVCVCVYMSGFVCMHRERKTGKERERERERRENIESWWCVVWTKMVATVVWR